MVQLTVQRCKRCFQARAWNCGKIGCSLPSKSDVSDVIADEGTGYKRRTVKPKSYNSWPRSQSLEGRILDFILENKTWFSTKKTVREFRDYLTTIQLQVTTKTAGRALRRAVGLGILETERSRMCWYVLAESSNAR